jgi:hypothetical protein
MHIRACRLSKANITGLLLNKYYNKYRIPGDILKDITVPVRSRYYSLALRIQIMAGMRINRLVYWAAGLSMFAILTHSIAVSDHLNEWWGYGVMFIIGAVFQLFYGIALIMQPWKYDEKGSIRDNAQYFGRGYYILGLVLTVMMVLIYLITRTTGMPFLGKDADAEPVTPLGLVPWLANLALLYLLYKLLRQSRVGLPEDWKSDRNKSPGGL